MQLHHTYHVKLMQELVKDTHRIVMKLQGKEEENRTKFMVHHCIHCSITLKARLVF